MNIGPVTSRPPEINVTDAVTLAYDRVKQMLFRPFDLGKWFTIGFCAWLATLGEAGGFNTGYGGGSNNHSNSGRHPAESFRLFYHQARQYVLENFHWLAPLVVAVIVFCLALWIALLWLNSRGKFMFLHCVALDRAEVQWPWTTYAAAGNSLFRFRLVVGLLTMVLFFPLIILLAVVIMKMIMLGAVNPGGLVLAAALVLVILLLALGLAILRKFMDDFVVPVMYLRGTNCLAAWREFLQLLVANPGHFALYLLFQIVLAMAIGAAVLVIILLTCCTAGCLMALPYIGTVALLPVLIFQRSYSLYYLAQFGAAHNVFPKPPTPPPSPMGNQTGSFPM